MSPATVLDRIGEVKKGSGVVPARVSDSRPFFSDPARSLQVAMVAT